MAFLPTNASQVQQFAGALYGIRVGTVTMAQVQADITLVGGLSKALNAYYTASFGTQTTAAVGTLVAANLGLTGTAATDAAAYITAVLNGTAASARGEAIQGVLSLFSTLTANATYGAAATAWNTKVEAAIAYTGASDSVAGATVAGGVFTLSTSADNISPNQSTVANQTTSGADTIYGTTLNSLNSSDVIDGGAGSDSLIADLDIPAANATTTIAPILSSVESVTIRNTGTTSDGGETLVLDTANTSGITSLKFDNIVAKTAADTISATNIASTATAVGVTNNATLAHNYTFGFANAALAAAADTVTLNVTANTTATGTVQVQTTSAAGTSGAETLAIVTSGTGTAAASTIGTLAVVAGDGTTANNTAKMTKLVVSGTADLTITNAIDFAGTTAGAIDATGLTAKFTMSAAPTDNEAITFTAGSGGSAVTTGTGNDKLTGGAGTDTFTIGTGFDTVVGGEGNDRVVLTAITELTANDSITLGDGARDTLAVGTWTAVNTTNFTSANKALINATGAEVFELTAADVTAVDFAALTQDIVYLTGGDGGNAQAAMTVSNVLTNDTLRITSDTKGTTAAATVTASGALPGQTLKLELYGAGVDLTNVATAATDHGLTLSSGISTLYIDSSKAASTTATTANTIGGALNAAANAILNSSAATVIITGSQALSISNTTTPGVTFGAAVSVDASAFTGTLTLGGSSSADVIKGGAGNDVITAGAGNDSIDLSAGGTDKLVYIASGGKDTITGFGSTDLLNVAILGDGTTGALTAVISAAAAQGALTDDSAYIINTTGAAANLTTAGTATVSDWTTLSQVAAYLNERFTTTATTENVFVVNVTGTSTTYVYDYVDAGTTSIAAAELTLVGVITRDAALEAGNVVFA